MFPLAVTRYGVGVISTEYTFRNKYKSTYLTMLYNFVVYVCRVSIFLMSCNKLKCLSFTIIDFNAMYLCTFATCISICAHEMISKFNRSVYSNML